jgi:hypothetical protein
MTHAVPSPSPRGPELETHRCPALQSSSVEQANARSILVDRVAQQPVAISTPIKANAGDIERRRGRKRMFLSIRTGRGHPNRICYDVNPSTSLISVAETGSRASSWALAWAW